MRAIVAAGDAKIILRSDNELAIFDLKCQAAAECRVRHGMTVIIDDTTEYESQDNALAGMAVREVKGVRFSCLVSNGVGQITRGQIGADGLTPHYLHIGKRASCLGVVETSSEFYVGTVLGVVRAPSLRRRPLEQRANVELPDKLVGVLPGDQSAETQIHTVISAEPIAEGAIPGDLLEKEHRAETTRTRLPSHTGLHAVPVSKRR